MDPFEAAARMAGIRFSGSETGSGKPIPAVGQVQRVSGIATSDSAGGRVFINLGGSSVTQDGAQGIEVPCECPVRAGQEVSVEIVATRPRVTGVVGWGDELASGVAEAAALAEAAILSVDVEYAKSQSQTVPPAGGWATVAPAWQEGWHIWQRTKTVSSTGESYSDPVCISGRDGQDGAQGPQGATGPQGPKGDDGTGISSVTVSYAVSANGTAAPADGWQQSVPSTSPGQYLWTRTITDYTDAAMQDTVAYSVSRHGATGSAGAAGTSVTVLSIQYQAGSSATSAPTGTWSNAVVSAPEGQYLWTKTTFSDGSVAYGVAKQGAKGSTGATGTGVAAIVEQYYLSTSATSQTGGSWQTSQPAWQEGWYIWTRSKITWTDSTVTYTAPVLAQAVNGANSAASQAQSDVDASRSWYAECTTAAATAAKVATITPATDAFALSPGKTVFVRFAATNTAPVASLTLDVNGTGAKPVKTLINDGLYNLYRASHLKANTTYQCTYDGSVWIVQQNVNVDTYDRIRHSSSIKAAAAIAAWRMVCGTDAGYRVLAPGVSFDASYPLLYATVAISAGAASAYTYDAYPGASAVNHGFGSGAAGRMLYLKGTLSGGTFTAASSGWLTTATPTSEDGMLYIPLGVMQSATHLYFAPSMDLHGFADGKFQRLDKAALAIADAAKAAADATAQHFWSDSDGAHVTQATQTEWEAAHSGPNSLWTSIGMLFRDGLTNLLGVLSGTGPGQRGIAVYDGEGNDATDIVASFTGAGSVVGKTTGQNVEIASGTISFRDALYTIVKIFNGGSTAGFDFMAGGGMMTGFLRGGKNEQLMWLHGNDRVCLGTISSANPMHEQVQIDDGGVTFKGSAGRDVYIDLGDGSAGSGGRIVASKLGNTPTSRIEQVAGRTGYGSPVDITGHGQASPYTVPSDGIVWAEANWRSGAYTQCVILSAAGAELFTIQQASPGTGSNASTAAQVFAGMRVYVNRNPSVPYGTARFIPYS